MLRIPGSSLPIWSKPAPVPELRVQVEALIAKDSENRISFQQVKVEKDATIDFRKMACWRRVSSSDSSKTR